jgi:hypothetical protein
MTMGRPFWPHKPRSVGRFPAEPDALLDVFIHLFLEPAAADGRLQQPEETPLIVAYHALHIPELQRALPAGTVEQRCAEAARAARGEPPAPLGRKEAQAAADLLHRCASRTTALGWRVLRDWLLERHPLVELREQSSLSSRPTPEAVIRDFDRLVQGIWPQQPELDETAESQPPRLLLPTAGAVSTPGAEATEPDPPVSEHDATDDACQRVLSGTLQQALRDAAPQILASVQTRLSTPWSPWLAFDHDRAGSTEKAVLVGRDANHVWMIGDVHGDLLALECAIAHVQAQDPDALLLFLGDLIDDGPFGYEVVLRVMQLLLERPDRIALLPGNHDEALRYDPDGNLFLSGVMPAEFTEQLNAHRDDTVMTGVARAFIALEQQLPRALFFRDGLMAAHGGIPQADLWKNGQLRSRADLDAPLCLQDFVWTRAHPKVRKRNVDRHSKGAEFGYEDFYGFCETATAVLRQPVLRLARGHDHVDERYSLYPAYKRFRILTLNTLCRRLSREWGGTYERMPSVGRGVGGGLPEVHRLRIPRQVVERVYPPSET